MKGEREGGREGGREKKKKEGKKGEEKGKEGTKEQADRQWKAIDRERKALLKLGNWSENLHHRHTARA